MIKNLRTLEKSGLLKSDSYGVKTAGKDKMWRVFTSAVKDSPKKNQDLVLEKLGFEVTGWKIHPNLYDHDKTTKEFFVSLVLTGRLEKWENEGDQKTGFRHDALFKLTRDARMFYVETEMGTHNNSTLKEKIEAYRKLFRQKKDSSRVLFVVPTEDDLKDMVNLFASAGATEEFLVVVQNEFIEAPLEASISNQYDTFRLISYGSIQPSGYSDGIFILMKTYETLLNKNQGKLG